MKFPKNLKFIILLKFKEEIKPNVIKSKEKSQAKHLPEPLEKTDEINEIPDNCERSHEDENDNNIEENLETN
jgi:hypothetical protein